MHILKKQTNIMVIIASTILILLGTYSKIFSLLAAIPILYLFMVLDEFSILCLLCYLMPFASIFKISPESQSFFTIFELLFCVMHFVKNNMKTNKINVFIILFGVYLVVIEILNGGINISATIKMVTNLLVLSFATSFNIEKGYRRLSLYYIYGIVISSIVGLFDSNIFHIKDYIGVTEQRIGDEFIMRFSGLYSDPNYYTVNIIIALCLLINLYNRKDVSLKFTSFLSVLLVVFSALTGSKSALLMLTIPMLLFLYTCKKTKHYGVLFVSICVFVICLFLIFTNKITIFSSTIDRIKGTTSMATLTTGRTSIWRDYLNYFNSHLGMLIMGHGINNVSLNGLMAHNTYIDMLFQMGIIGTFLLMVLLSVIFYTKKEKIKHNFSNYSVIISSLVMYFFLSELQYYDLVFHLIMSYFTLNVYLDSCSIKTNFIKFEDTIKC